MPSHPDEKHGATVKKLRAGSIKTFHWKAGKRRGFGIRMTPAGMRWWLKNIAGPKDTPLDEWAKQLMKRERP